jgi:hypothetical protein
MGFFLQQALRMKGFDLKWCKCQEFISRGSVEIRVNNNIGIISKREKDYDNGILFLPSFLKLLRIC